MTPASNRGYPELTPEFGHYFAGLADGEGHFGIVKVMKRGKAMFNCHFVIVMRDDDRELIEWLHETTGLGSVYSQGARQKIGHLSKPQVIWRIHSKGECLALADIFEQYPLHSRKARDLAIWTSAVRYLNGDRPHGWNPMERWFKLIREVREYGESEVELEDELDILSLFDSDTESAQW